MLRRAGRLDIDALAAIHAASFPPKEAWSRNVFDLQLSLPNVFGLQHAAGGLILARVAADEAEILSLAVVPASRRRGLGHQMLMEATRTAATMGARAMYLEVSTANIAAQSLYTKVGFVETGRRLNYYLDASDALVLRLDLNPPE